MALLKQVSAETAKLINDEIVNTAKFSFVIAHEFQVHQSVVAKIAKSVLGSRLFNEREKIALAKLYKDYQELLKQGLKKEETFAILHINKNCGWKILNRYQPQDQNDNAASEASNSTEIVSEELKMPVSLEADNSTTQACNNETVEAKAIDPQHEEDLDIIVINDIEDGSCSPNTKNPPHRSLGALNYLLSNPSTSSANTKEPLMPQSHLICKPMEEGGGSDGGGNEFSAPNADHLIHLNYQGMAISYQSNLSPEQSIIMILKEISEGFKL